MKSGTRFSALCVLLFAAAVPLRAEDGAPAPSDALLAFPTTAWVTVPVADVRDVPSGVDGSAALRRPYAADPHQETQVIYGEKVTVFEKRGPWARVEAVEQPEFNHHEIWEGYPGWVPMDALTFDGSAPEPNAVVRTLYTKLQESSARGSPSVDIPLGSRVRVAFRNSTWARIQRRGRGDGWVRIKDLQFFDKLPKGGSSLRKAVLKTARLFMDQPYYWGGRSPHRNEDVDRPTGVDCSSLVNLSFRANGVDVPRDSHEQYLKSKPLRVDELLPGDLIFLAKPENPNKIVHVMLYAGGEKIIEAVEQFDIVRQVTLKEKLGLELRDVWPGERTGYAGKSVVLDRYVYFGRFLPE